MVHKNTNEAKKWPFYSKESVLKISITSLIILFCVFTIYYFHFYLGIKIVFTHIFYVPIALAGFWFGKKCIWVAIFLGVCLIIPDVLFGPNAAYIDDLLRVVMFIIVAWFIGILREKNIVNEKVLKESREKYETIFTNVPLGILYCDKYANIIDCNEHLAEILGSTREKIIGINLKNTDDRIYSAFSKAFSCEKGYFEGEYTSVTSGKIVPIRVIWKPLRLENSDISGGVAIVEDIAERKLAEEEIKNKHQKLMNIIEFLPDATFVIDEEGKIVAWNRAIEDMTGLSKKGVIGKDSYFYSMPFYGRPVLALVELIDLDDKNIKERYEYVERNGETLFAEVFAPSLYNGKGAYIWIKATPLFDSEGNIIGGIQSIRDISQRKSMEKELFIRTQELERSNSELEQFAYVASHDLQEPLRMVASFVQLLARRYKGKLDSDADEFINYAVDGARRMQMLINDILDYSRVGTRGKEFKPTDCEDILDKVLTSLRQAIEESGAVITHDTLPVIKADYSQINMLFQNLINNAIKFCGDKSPKIHIGVKQKEKEWQFNVSDNGIGIAPEFFERIFIIFQRLHTRDEYPGTGIGLAICKKIVERHGGRIWLESKPEKGSTFHFTIPRERKE